MSTQKHVRLQAYKEALTSAGPALRSDTRKRLQTASEAGEAAVIREATIQAKADKVKAEKAETDEAKAANKHQAKAMNNGKRQDAAVPIVTKAQKDEALKIWKELLITTNHYQPFIQRTEGEKFKGS